MNKFLLLILNILFIYLTSNAQSLSSQDDVFFNSLSYQSTDFSKMGNTSVSMFLGEVDVQVPIYTYKDKDFNIPVFLKYNSDGFTANKREGIVGLNWVLNAGGGITRRVNGVPDERMGTSYSDPSGWYYAIKEGTRITTISNTEIFNLEGLDDYDGNFYFEVDDCETEPDEFFVNSPGCNGRFFIQNDGTIHFIGDKNYTVDFSNFGEQTSIYMVDNSSEIVITSDDGYKYYFGGSLSCLGISSLLDDYSGINQSIINCWYLTKIVVPNGREVIYNYRQHTYAYPDPEHNEGQYLLNIHDFDYVYASAVKGEGSSFLDGYFSCGGSAESSKSYTINKPALLEKIEIDGSTSINFSYSLWENKFYTDVSFYYNYYDLESLGLDSIYVQYGNNTLKTFLLDYEYTGGSIGKRYFLSSFQEKGIPAYKFSYYKQSQIPDPETHGIDYWNFWNGGSYSNKLIPTMSYDIASGTYEYTSTIREPDADKCDVGLLEKIKYPTGGYSQLIYEGNQYSKRLERRNDNGFLPALYPEEGNAGGARIKKIIWNDGTNNVLTKEYKYFKNYPDTTSSSGILLEWPRYIHCWVDSTVGFSFLAIKKHSDGFQSNYNSNEKFIHYSEVAEIYSSNNTNNGCTVQKFTNFETNPDVIDYNVIDVFDTESIINRDLFNNYIGIKNTDYSFQRGFPYETSVYSNSGTLLKRKKITAFTSPLSPEYSNHYLVGVFQTGGIAASYKVSYYPFLPLSEIETNYYNGDSVYIITSYNYSDDNYTMLRKTSSIKSNGDTSITYFRYPYDFAGITVYDSLISRNRISPVIEKIDSLNNSFLRSTKTNYHFFQNDLIINPSYVEEKIGTSAFEPRLTYHDYDSKGNLLSLSKPNDVNETYLYSYNQTYPVVKAENIDYTTLESLYTAAVSSSGMTDYSELASVSLDDSQKAKLRSFNTAIRSNQPVNAFITTYTYAPLIGMTSQTDPNGVTTYYEYDGFGRLKYVKDNDGNILKSYEYNYQQ